jgi:catechol 2,3-dioxygenase-like lactoylglutathione lyase family enzyme
MTAAHTTKETLSVSFYFPEHEPRESDPHYHLFNAARARLKRLGKLACWRCGATERIELHHALVEFSLANGVDVARFAALYPEFHVENDEDFLAFCESEGNLLALCRECHRGSQGIHSVVYSAWVVGRFWKHDLPPAAEVVPRD